MCWCEVLKLERRIICRGCGAVVYVEIWCSHGGGCLNLACVIFLSHIIKKKKKMAWKQFHSETARLFHKYLQKMLSNPLN